MVLDWSSPHTKSMGNGLFEVLAKVQEGLGQALCCYMRGQHIILHVFIKKSQKILQHELELAKNRGRKMNLQTLKNKAFQNAEVKEDYAKLAAEFEFIDKLLTMRGKAGLSQEEIAQKMNTQRSNISRLEHGRINPNWKTLQKYAEACGFTISLKIKGL